MMNVHNQVMASMKEMVERFAEAGVSLELPPPSNQTLGTEYIAMEPGKSLSARFPFNARFANPLRMFQGGFLCAAFDEVFGPLTYMLAGQPAVTLEMSTSYVRPFTSQDGSISITAELVSKTKSVILLRAEAKTQEGKLIATASNHSLVISESKLKAR